ncbi:MAG: hydroxymethylglutaryl-CoA lyase [Candidatus Roseilinea sp.]|nr:MAG: hydroxymethylglutaryl-CoA lyase [Candidatus Roseilinea sp.]
MNIPAQITVVEVGPRDGFQMERAFIPTDLKVEIIDLLSSSGVPAIEATSFVNPKVIPQMADSDAVMQRIRRRPGVRYGALILNVKGAQRALAARADAVRFVVCASETYNHKNMNMSIAQSLAALRDVVEICAPVGVGVEPAVSVAFGCPFEGEVPESRVVALAEAFAAMGLRDICIADTVGLASPRSVRRLLDGLRCRLPTCHFSLHLHDTRGLGLANVLAAMDAGVTTFEASLGGLGGCPTTKVATGNISTEDLVNLCDEMGIATGVDVEVIREASRRIQDFLGRPLPSHVLAAGTRRALFARAGEGC